MKLAMVMKVKDEDDILEDTLRYHAAQGVDVFVVTDNGSTDGTPEILKRWVEAGRMQVIDEPSAGFRDEAHGWVTRMARLAATDHGADWVLHTDADEFWWPVSGDLRSSLEGISADYGVVVTPRIEFVPRPDAPGTFFERMTVRESESSLRPKLAHRAEPDVVLRRGAHDIDVERGADGMPKAGRPVLRGIREDDPDDDRRLIFAPAWPLRVMHFPLRSYDQYRRRVEVMLAGTYEDRARKELREHYDAGRLPELWEEIAYDDEQVEAGLRDGSLARDERLRDFMAACPDAAAAAAGERAQSANHPSDDAAAAEMDEIALDAMRAVTRTEQGLIRQREELRRRLERRERQLRKARRRLRKGPRGLRARIGAALGEEMSEPATPSVAFFVCCESGPLEQQALLFTRSLQRFGGRFAGCSVHAYKPRTGPELEPATLAGFEELGVELHSEALNTEHHDYPFANKMYAGVAAERELDADVVVFCDTDTVFLSPPDALDFGAGTDVAAAPAWHINKASQGPGHPMEEYWQEIYAVAGVTDPPWVETMEKGKRIRGYWNAGILATRREAGIFGEWLELFTRLFEEKRFPEGRMIVTDQVALAATISRRPDHLVNLDHTYNYDIGRRSFFKNEMRRIQLPELTQIHYHQWFNRRNFLSEVRPRFDTENEQFRWLEQTLPLEPATDAPIPRKRHKRKGVRGWLRRRNRKRALHKLRPTERG